MTSIFHRFSFQELGDFDYLFNDLFPTSSAAKVKVSDDFNNIKCSVKFPVFAVHFVGKLF